MKKSLVKYILIMIMVMCSILAVIGCGVEYQVRFVDEDGTEISNVTYKEGDIVVIPSNPSKKSDENYDYTFSGWDKEVVPVEGSVTYTATYTSSPRSYVVKFFDEDGSELSSKSYHKGEDVVLPSNPTKASDNTYTYTFNGWDKEVTKVSGDAQYKATYSKEYIEYTVKFLDEDRSEIASQTYHYGDTVVLPADPTKDSDNTYTYAFSGWGEDVLAVSGDKTYTAVYTPSFIDYTIVFIDEDESEISRSPYHYGDTVVLPADPTKDSDNTYTYTFNGWNTEIVPVNGNATYKATYASEYIDYTVIFINDDESEISTSTYHYGDTVVVPSNVSKNSTTVFDFEFKGWDREVTTVTDNIVYKAEYNSILKKDLTGNNVASPSGEKVLLKKGTIDNGGNYTGPNNNEYIHQSYLAFDGEYGLNSYVVLDFTGKNMPEIAFFAKNYNESMYYQDGSKQGIVFVNGITTYNGDVNNNIEAYKGGTTVNYEFPFMINNAGNGSFTEGGFIDSKLARANLVDTEKYRVIIGFTAKGDRAIQLNWRLINRDNGEIIEEKSISTWDFFTGSYAQVNNMTLSDLVGSIVLYGKFGVDLTLDKVWGIFENATIDKIASGIDCDKLFTITFKDENSNTLDQVGVAFGDIPKFTKELPSGENIEDGIFSYTYNWDRHISRAIEDTTYTLALAASKKENVTLYNVEANNGAIKIKKGSIGAGANYVGPNDNELINLSYIAFDGEYGLGNYVVIDFTGKNMPEIAFFAKNYNNSMYYQAGGKQGVVVVSGITMWNGEVNTGILSQSTMVHYGFPNMIKDLNNGEFTQNGNQTSNLARANLVDGKKYRVVMGFRAYDEKAIELNWTLIDLSNKEIIEQKSINTWNFFTGSNDKVNNMTLSDLTGSIVFYGKFGIDTNIDHLYSIESGDYDTIVSKYTPNN